VLKQAATEGVHGGLVGAENQELLVDEPEEEDARRDEPLDGEPDGWD
jgi:hypothetical protein